LATNKRIIGAPYRPKAYFMKTQQWQGKKPKGKKKIISRRTSEEARESWKERRSASFKSGDFKGEVGSRAKARVVKKRIKKKRRHDAAPQNPPILALTMTESQKIDVSSWKGKVN